MENEFEDFIEEDGILPKKEDWHIKDNIVQALNIINRDKLARNHNAKLESYNRLVSIVKEISKKQGCSLLDATIQLKEKAKKDHEKFKSKK